jgi:hypothetical protein
MELLFFLPLVKFSAQLLRGDPLGNLISTLQNGDGTTGNGISNGLTGLSGLG